MKDKKAEQIAARQRHKDKQKEKRRSESTLSRPDPALLEKPTILIVCEGKNTEPSYFKQFRLTSATIKAVGSGYNTISLVNQAIQLASQKHYDQVWCVFDKDNFSNADFNNAITVASASGFGVAYSNQAFEYWIILHFEDHQGGGMHRSTYNNKINKLLNPFGLVYDGVKSKKITEDIFEVLDGFDEKYGKERKILASERAERNYNMFNHSNPASEESSTTMFRLLNELLKYI